MAGFPGQSVVRNWGHDRAKGEVTEAWKNAPAWLREYEAEYRRRGMKPTTIVRFTHELLNLHHDFGIDLATVNDKTLLNHLDAYQKTHKSNSYRVHCVIIKHALKMSCLTRTDLAEKIILPRRMEPEATVKTIPREERERLIHEAPSLQERLAIELLDETGGRRGELWKLRIKDVQFEEVNKRMTAILRLDGKTGVRRRRIYGAVADLRQQINNNPHRNDAEMTVFYKKDGTPYTSIAFYRLVKRLGHKILRKNIHPHMFRHSRATEDCRSFTDQEMMKLFGWKRPDQVMTYTHLSMKDVDEKDLVLHGLKQKEEILRPIMQIQRCTKCGEDNAPIALYCGKCGAILGPEDQLTKQNAELAKRVKQLEGRKSLFEEMRENPELAEQFFQSPRVREILGKILQETGSK